MFEIKLRERTELSVQQQKEIQYKLDTILKPHGGHSVFEINLLDMTIELAKHQNIDTVNLFTWEAELKNLEVIKNNNCIYISCLNLNNLKDKMFKVGLDITHFQINVTNDKNTHKNRKVKFLKNN